MPRLPRASSLRRTAAAAGAALMLTAVAGPATAAEPHRVIANLDGVFASTTFLRQERSGEFDRFTYTTVSLGRQRILNPGDDPPANTEGIMVGVETYLLPIDRQDDSEVAAVIVHGGTLETDGLVDIDAKYLTYASLPSIAVTLDLLYCSPAPGWEDLCAGLPTQRSISVAAELTGSGELEENRYRTPRDELGTCLLHEVGYNASRDAGGTVWIDGVPYSRLIPWLTYITEGWDRFLLRCDI